MEVLNSITLDASSLAVLGGLGASLLHSLAKSQRWGKGLNLGLAIGYSLLIGAADAFLRSQLNAGDILGSAVVALGAAQSFYTLNFLQSKWEGRVSPKELPVNATP